MGKRLLSVNVLPGEPLNGDGRVCVHLFVRDERGPFVEPHVLHPAVKDGEVVKGQLEARATRGRLACDRKRNVAPVRRGTVTTITPRTDDPRAVTCLKCCASAEYKAMMEQLATAEAAR